MGLRRHRPVAGAGAADHHPARRPAGRRGRCGAVARTGRRARRGHRPRASPVVADSGFTTARRRNSRRTHDQSRLAAHHRSSRGAGHRQRRHDLPRRYRRPRTRRAVRGRRSHRHHHPHRRPPRDGRRHRRTGPDRDRELLARRSRDRRIPRAHNLFRGHRHADLSQSRPARSRRANGRLRCRRCRTAPRGNPAHPGARRSPPPRAHRPRRATHLRRDDDRVPVAHHRGVRPAARGVPGDRSTQQ